MASLEHGSRLLALNPLCIQPWQAFFEEEWKNVEVLYWATRNSVLVSWGKSGEY